MANNRKRSLLDLAHDVHECTNCGRYVTEGCEPAHQNGITAGKGQGIKSHDNRHAAMCHDCHAFYDSGTNGYDPTNRYLAIRRDKREMWLAAHLKTFDYYWEQAWITVNAS